MPNHFFTIGKDGAETSPMSLDKFLHNDFERGETDTYDVSGEDVGDVVMITLKEHFLKSNWYIAKVIVEKIIEDTSFENKYIFPCYRWVVDEIVVYEGSGNGVLSSYGPVIIVMAGVGLKRNSCAI